MHQDDFNRRRKRSREWWIRGESEMNETSVSWGGCAKRKKRENKHDNDKEQEQQRSTKTRKSEREREKKRGKKEFFFTSVWWKHAWWFTKVSSSTRTRTHCYFPAKGVFCLLISIKWRINKIFAKLKMFSSPNDRCVKVLWLGLRSNVDERVRERKEGEKQRRSSSSVDRQMQVRKRKARKST